MELMTALTLALNIIGVATVLLHLISPLTKWKGDDKLVKFLNNFLKLVSLNQKEGKLEIIVRK